MSDMRYAIKIEIRVMEGIRYINKTRLALSKASLGGIKMKKLSVCYII